MVELEGEDGKGVEKIYRSIKTVKKNPLVTLLKNIQLKTASLTNNGEKTAFP